MAPFGDATNARRRGDGEPEIHEKGFGLVGLRERAELLNGQIRFETAPGKGFFFEMKLPG